MGIGIQCCGYLFVTKLVRKNQCITALIDKQTGVRMANVMNSDTLHTGILTASVHLMGEIRFCNRKQSFSRVKHISGVHIFLKLPAEKIRNRNFSLALSCLWCSKNIFPMKPLIGFVDINLFCDKAKQGFRGGSRGDTEWSQWVQSEKEQLSAVMERHGIEWEHKGTHEKHLSVLDYKKQEREKEVVQLEGQILEQAKAFAVSQRV